MATIASGMAARRRERTQLWGLVPMVVVQVALFVVPLAIMFVYSFWTTRNYQIVPEWTLANYRTFFASWTYPGVLFRTLWTSAVITVVTLLMAYPLAYVIVRYTRRWQRILLGAVVLSFWTSGLLRAYAWMALLGHGGIINKGLRELGLIEDPLPFLLYSNFAVVLVMTYFSLPFAVITIYASLEKMDWSLVNAASDLGAGPLRTFWFVTLPQTMAGVISAGVLTFVPLMGMFFVPLLVGDASSAMIAPLIANQMQAFQLGLGAALSFIVAVFVMAAVAMAWRYIDIDRQQRTAA
jgi:ABC-type spermidine/putrescine transport system permease subunit I